jgi:DNA-binding YbaB/EbfC family protein
MFNKLKQFKDIRSRAKDLQSALGEETAEGSAGWGKVKIVMDGNQKVKNVSIDESLLNDKKGIEEGVKDAVNDAVSKIQHTIAKKMKELGGSDLARDVQDMMGNK